MQMKTGVREKALNETVKRIKKNSLELKSRSVREIADLQKIIKEGSVLVNGSSVKASYRMDDQDEVTIDLPELKEPEIEAENIPLDILYEDDDLLMVNKPKGMVVHPSAGHTTGTLVNAVMYHCKEDLSGINGVMRPGIVHRIDKDTTGVLVICKNDKAHNFVAEQLKEHSITRKYRAIVNGVIKEDEGTELLEDKVKEAVAAAVMSLEESVDLEEQGCYVSPSITSEDEALKTACETMNKYVGARITYQFGDKSETLSGDEIRNWLTVNGTSVGINEGKATEYVKKLAASYDTAYKAKSLKTSYGKTVSITGGSYGYKINQAKEAATLVSLIKNGEQTSREPEYSQKGASRTGNDYGNTYVEINLTAQHLYFYVKGKLVVQSDFVSGNAAKGWSTPAGAYSITYKQRNATLKGQGYATPVSYWMPFNGGIGLHDANWRKTFGGTIYKTNGSHGCVNLPPAVAKTIYENISAGDPVLCYHLDGTESASTSGTKKDETAATTAAATTAAPKTTAAPTTAAPETTAAPTTAAPTTEAPTTPAAGGDQESVGPGFAPETEGTTEQEVGPGF